MHADIHTSNGIRIHDPSVRAGEDSSCLTPSGQCDRALDEHAEEFLGLMGQNSREKEIEIIVSELWDSKCGFRIVNFLFRPCS
jgi:hypothetical protein